MDSPFQQHLGTNYVPTVDEAKQIQDLLEISGQNLRCIDTEIDQLQQQLDLFQAKRSIIRNFAEQHRALLSPARKLTRDIIEEIFIACLPEDRNPYMSTTEAPMILTRICSSWRRIVLSTPRIWSEIHITLPNVKRPDWNYLTTQEEELLRQRLDQQQAAVKKWLDRSGSCPLSISVCHTGHLSGLITVDAEAFHKTEQKLLLIYQQYIRDTIIPHHQRWYNLDISFPMNILRGLIEIGLKTEDLKMLKELHITRQAPLSSESMICEWKDIISLLSLNVTSATFYNIRTYNSDAYSIPLHAGWGRLTELNLNLNQEPMNNTDLVGFASAIISRCKLLKALKLGIYFGNYDDSALQSGEDIILQHLTTLSLSVPTTNGVLGFLKRLYLPSIKELNIQISRYNRDDAFRITEEIINPLLHTHGNCHSLGLYVPDWLKSTNDLVQLLKVMPYLKCLKVSSKDIIHNNWLSHWSQLNQTRYQYLINDDLLYALTPLGKEYSDIICPQLEELECDNSILTDITESVLNDFVKARKGDPRIAALHRLSLFVKDPKSKEDPTEEELSFGTDSAVFFRKPERILQSHLGGFVGYPSTEYTLPTEFYTEIYI